MSRARTAAHLLFDERPGRAYHACVLDGDLELVVDIELHLVAGAQADSRRYHLLGDAGEEEFQLVVPHGQQGVKLRPLLRS